MNVTTRASVIEVREVSPSLFLLTMRPEYLRSWDPGMFVQLTLEQTDWSRPWPLSKPFSLASWGGSHIRLLIRREGRFTSRLIEKAHAGSQLTIKYPFGDLVLDRAVKYCLVAGGAGVSPFLSFLDYYVERRLSTPVVLIHSVRRHEELVSEFYWRDLPGSVRVCPWVTSEHVQGDPRRHLDIIDALQVTGVRDNSWHFVVSGPPQFTRTYVRSLSDAGFGNVQIESWQGTVDPPDSFAPKVK